MYSKKYNSNLVRDPEIRHTQGENSMAVARFTLAVSRKKKNADGQYESDFINCVSFGKQAEFAEKHFLKGMKIAVIGHIQTGSYTKRDGSKVYTTDVMVEEQEFCEKPKMENHNTYYGGDDLTGTPASQLNEGFMNVPEGVEDEGLPFN